MAKQYPWEHDYDLDSHDAPLLHLDKPIHMSSDRYKEGFAQDGDRCGICGIEFLAGEVVTAVISGGTVGIKCADGESCHERTMIKLKS